MDTLYEDLARERAKEAIKNGLKRYQSRGTGSDGSSRVTSGKRKTRNISALGLLLLSVVLLVYLTSCSIGSAASLPERAKKITEEVETFQTLETEAVPVVSPTANKVERITQTPTTEMEGLSEPEEPASRDPVELEGMAAALNPPDTVQQAAIEQSMDGGYQRSPIYKATLTADRIDFPAEIPPGLIEIIVENKDAERHSAIFRRLNEDVSLEEFASAFVEDPIASLPMTFAIGGPSLAGGESVYAVYFLEPGTYVMVDVWVEPARYISFSADGLMIDAAEPTTHVDAKVREYEILIPESIASGPQLWKIFNQGEFLHNIGILQLAEDKSIDDLAAWLVDGNGPPPMEIFGFWNLMSPGATSRAVFDLQPGEYLAVDFLPDPATPGIWNMQQGMAQPFTVTP